MTNEHYKAAHERMEDILLYFDFEKVHDIMSMMEWCWGSWEDEEDYTHNDEVPSVFAIKHAALRLMRDALEHESSMECGGLRVQFGSEEDWFDEDGNCLMGLEFIAVSEISY